MHACTQALRQAVPQARPYPVKIEEPFSYKEYMKPPTEQSVPKKRIRQTVLTRRQALSPSAVEQKSRVIQERVGALSEYISARILHSYVSSKDNEVDTHHLIQEALSQGKRVVVPVTEFAARVLRHVEIQSLEQLRPTRWGLLEPQGDDLQQVDISDIDLVLVPGLAFDRTGCRIGFGGGFYDRFLAEVKAPKIGLAYDLQIMDHIPSESCDVKMDKIVTERQIYIT